MDIGELVADNVGIPGAQGLVFGNRGIKIRVCGL